MKYLYKILKLLIENFGGWGTVCMLLFIFALAVAWDWWRKRSEKEMRDQLIEEKERTINRIAEENRHLRKLILKERGLSADEISSLVEDADPLEATLIPERKNPEPEDAGGGDDT